LTLASSNVGSLGGLLALQRGEAHLAGSHLLDAATGEYNLPFIRRYIKERAVVVVNLVHRIQGFIVPPGNPKTITTLADLTRQGITFVNRQRGSGTRVLLDYLLTQQVLTPEHIAGYEREEFTHMAVAVAIASGLADVGLGVRSAAHALDLDFIAIGEEQYDLLFLRSFFESNGGANLMDVIGSAGFRQAVETLGGYDASRSGEIIYRQ
jgi:putative molybdopterin biosynthesis protein